MATDDKEGFGFPVQSYRKQIFFWDPLLYFQLISPLLPFIVQKQRERGPSGTGLLPGERLGRKEAAHSFKKIITNSFQKVLLSQFSANKTINDTAKANMVFVIRIKKNPTFQSPIQTTTFKFSI